MVSPRRRIDPVQRYRYLRSRFQGQHLAAPRNVRWLLVGLALGIYVFNFFTGDHGVFRRMQLDAELRDVAANNASLRLEKERLIQEVQAREDDPMSLERLAREKYWMIGPNEIIYRFEDDEVVPELDLGEAEEDPEGGP